MKQHKQAWATIGLVFITFLAAIQYIFLQKVPDTLPTFAFVCITNVIGLLILGLTRIKKILQINGRTLKKGIVFAVELTGMNVFLLLGSRHLDSVVIASAVSLYFVFITPIMLLLRKKINFFSSIATVIAIIALMLMFEADTDKLFASTDVVYLIIADIFFAAYVVSVSILGEKEDTSQLTFSQMLFSACFALVGWLIESAVTGKGMSIPAEPEFWISALFVGVFIRALYGIIQIAAQKHVSTLKTSLIFASEILITLIINPIMCKLLHVEYTPATFFQVVGCLLFIIATLMVDDGFMFRLGYEDLKETTYVNVDGETIEKSSVSKKVISTTLAFALLSLLSSIIICVTAIYYIRNSSIDSSKELGENASSESAQALMLQLEKKITDQAADKTLLAAQKLEAYSDSVQLAASYAHTLLTDPDAYPSREIGQPKEANAGKWVMQRGIADESIAYEDLEKENKLIGNIDAIFAPLVANNDNVATIYLGTKDGLILAYDPNSFDPEAENGELYFEFRDTTWYQRAQTIEGYAFTDTYQDSYGRGLTITCVAPFTDAEGNFFGCVAMDVLMSELNESMVNDGIVIPSYAVLIDHEGNYIAGRDLDPNSEKMGNIFDETSDESLRLAGREILEKKEGIVSTGEGEDAKYIAFSTLESTDWTLCILTPVSSVLKPAVMIRESIDQNTDNVVTTVRQSIMKVIQSCLVLSALILVCVTLFASRVSKRISNPLKKLEEDVRRISGGNLEQRTDVKTDDEIGSLANSFNVMTDSLQKYITDLKEVTAKEQRIAGELSAATTIQASMLPGDFEIFSSGKPFELYASMHPAKEVGGDFYDYFMTDDTHLGLVMADVSGKGVPAALFMAIAKTLIRNRAMMGGGPAEILKYVNEQLCEGNEAELFVTVWFAILDLETGKGLAANAGHEHPAIRRAGGNYELAVYRHSPAVAAMEGIRFREHEFELHPGDSLFVYTDGVAEAMNAGNELFGTERMLEVLNRDPDAGPETLLNSIKQSIDVFVGDTPQFDDITMLGLYYEGGKKEKMSELTVDARVENLEQVLAFVDGFVEQEECAPKAGMQIDVAVEELFVNIASYAYPSGTGTATISLKRTENPRAVEITLTDSGIPYDPLAKADPDVTLPAEERQIGGLGIYMVKKSMDEVKYRYEDGKNILTIRKNL